MPDDNQGASQNQPNPEPKYVTADDIGNMINAAVTSHLKRSLGTAIEAAIKPFSEKFAAQQQQVTDSEDNGKKKTKSNMDPELAAMAAKVADMEKALTAEKDRVAVAEKKSRDDSAYSSLRKTLEGKVRPEFLDMVAKHLFVVEGRVQVDESGNPLFKSQRAPMWAGGEPEDVMLPLESGVVDFLKSDVAKAFLPSPATSSVSPLPRRGVSPIQTTTDFTKPATSDGDKIKRAQERERMARDRLGIR